MSTRFPLLDKILGFMPKLKYMYPLRTSFCVNVHIFEQNNKSLGWLCFLAYQPLKII